MPSTVFVATDHLNTLLTRNGYIRRDPGTDSGQERFSKVTKFLGVDARGTPRR